MEFKWQGNYIAGRFSRPKKGREIVSQNPGDLLNPVGTVVVSSDAVDEAVAQAAKAFPRWSQLPLNQRINRMKALVRSFQKRKSILIDAMAREAGKPLSESIREADRLLAKVEEMVRWGLPLVRSYEVSVAVQIRGECRYRPLGVLAVIGPFNFPAHTPASHLVPALLTGNTVVFKPSEHTPFVGQILADCFHEAGFPAGVFNLVQGDADVGMKLVAHPHIAGILFTGSTAVGQMIKQATVAQPQKNLALEMGGKNAALILADADVELAAREIAMAAFSMSGQRCNATSRVIVDRRVAKKFIAKFLEMTDRVKIGYPLEEGNLMGPLISHDAVAKFQHYMRLAAEEGFEILRFGKALGTWGKRRGYYVTPAVHLCERPSRNSSTHYRCEEIFGPDVAIYFSKSDEEAVRINNEVSYGLVTALFTRSRSRFQKLSSFVDTGLVNWNRGTIFSSGRLPFGGTKASGSFKPAGLLSPYYCTYPVAILEDRRPLAKRSLPF